MYKKILVPVDGSEGGWKALTAAKEVAEAGKSELVVMTVVQVFAGASIMPIPVESGKINEELGNIANDILAQAKEKVGGVKAEFVAAPGRPSKVIVDTAKKSGADLVVIGSRGLSGLAEFFLGSVSSEVAQLSPVSVLIVK
ncbi:MAG: universal stress protein [Phascolarctobacterium sp.]|nr:universal stress protein [Candidatus Phascolarctobacterium equi]